MNWASKLISFVRQSADKSGRLLAKLLFIDVLWSRCESSGLRVLSDEAFFIPHTLKLLIVVSLKVWMLASYCDERRLTCCLRDCRNWRVGDDVLAGAFDDSNKILMRLCKFSERRFADVLLENHPENMTSEVLRRRRNTTCGSDDERRWTGWFIGQVRDSGPLNKRNLSGDCCDWICRRSAADKNFFCVVRRLLWWIGLPFHQKRDELKRRLTEI